MRIIGIDPGTVAMGYGVVDSDGGETTLVDYGVLTAKARSPMGERLAFLYNGILEIITKSGPDAVAIEQPFVAKNVKSALAIGKAQAVAILAAAQRGIPTFEYTPTQVKQRVTNYGASSKEQIQEMVRLQLGMERSPESTDAADALAVALCHISEVHLSNLLGGQ
ncbi:MAG: crossover junction endodeoxyribonuclease RuvC [Dehalococcoidales bacterium]